VRLASDLLVELRRTRRGGAAGAGEGAPALEGVEVLTLREGEERLVAEGGGAGVGSSIENTRVVSESDPPKKNHRTRVALLLKNILKYFKLCPDQIRDQMDDNAEEPRSNPSLKQYSEFCQILRTLQH
jgi:hypothetical protein